MDTDATGTIQASFAITNNDKRCGSGYYSTRFLKALPSLAGGLADLVLTDPPYLVDYHDGSGLSIQGDKDGGWLKPAFAEIQRVMMPGAFCVCFYGWNRVGQFMAAWKAAGLRPVGHMVFVKGYESGAAALGYWHESAYLLKKGQGGPTAELHTARYPAMVLHRQHAPSDTEAGAEP